MKKITPFGLELLLATHLNGIVFFEALIKTPLALDSDGTIKEHAIDNIKTFIKVAIKQQLDTNNPYFGKSKLALKSLLDYGTREASKRMEEFLQALDANPGPLLKKEGGMSKLPAYLFELTGDHSYDTDRLGQSMGVFINQLAQKEDLN